MSTANPIAYTVGAAFFAALDRVNPNNIADDARLGEVLTEALRARGLRIVSVVDDADATVELQTLPG